jgi:hypothetical protein
MFEKLRSTGGCIGLKNGYGSRKICHMEHPSRNARTGPAGKGGKPDVIHGTYRTVKRGPHTHST